MKTSKATSHIAFACLIVLALICAVVLGACGRGLSTAAGTSVRSVKSDEEVIREGVGKSLDAVLAKDDNELLVHLLHNASYTITDVAVSGTDAEAKVSIQHIDANKALEAARAIVQSDDEPSTIAELFHQGKADELEAHLLQTLYTCLDESNDMTVSEVFLKLVKQGDTWSLDDECLDALTAALVGSQ